MSKDRNRKKIVLVGTYAGDQLKDWPGFYPYPLAAGDKVDAEDCKRVNEIWLFNGTKEARYFAAEFVGVKTKAKVSNYSKVFYRLNRSMPAPTVVPGHNAFPVHPTLNRTLTVREAARLQTFPDSYEFVGPIINQALQVGNAFPCVVAQTFGERLRTVENCGWEAGETTVLAKKSMIGGK